MLRFRGVVVVPYSFLTFYNIRGSLRSQGKREAIGTMTILFMKTMIHRMRYLATILSLSKEGFILIFFS